MTHNCWHNCELTQALQSLAPAYGDEAHTKVAERMVKDMEAQHTPGLEYSDFGYRVRWDGGRLVANVVGTKQDAALVNAAPDLLAALEASLPMLMLARARAEAERDTKAVQHYNATIDAARAAIAKAKGGA